MRYDASNLTGDGSVKHAPRELRRPGGYFLEYGTTGENPVKLTLEDMPFWDANALLEAVRFQISLPAANSGDQATKGYQYRVDGVVNAEQCGTDVSFYLERSINPNAVYSWAKQVLIATYEQRAKAEAKLLASRPLHPAQLLAECSLPPDDYQPGIAETNRSVPEVAVNAV
jgi:hypothetical protein